MALSIPEQVKGLPQADEPAIIPSPKMHVPYAIFYKVNSDGRPLAFPCRVDQLLCSTEQDIGVIRVLPHPAFKKGFPVAEISSYVDIHEGLEIGTCGFPLGNFLQAQIGAVTSSFTFGSISTISPYSGVPLEHLKMIQLDMTATHGNSGGPVFNRSNEKIIGVLQGGILHTSGVIQPGLVRCEPVFRFLSGNEIDLLKSCSPGKLPSVDQLKSLRGSKLEK